VSNLPPPSSAQPSLPPWPPQGPPVQKRPTKWAAIAALAISVLAIGVAIGSWFRPMPTNKPAIGPTYTSQEVADAKSKVCTAFDKAHKAIQLTGARDRGQDYATQLASAVNARQALVAGSEYLSTTLSDAPATPPNIAKEIRNLTNVYQLLTVQLLAEAPDSEINASVSSGDTATSTLENLCRP
jgi:hypothetical protein